MNRRSIRPILLLLSGTVLLIGCIPWSKTEVAPNERSISWWSTIGLRRTTRDVILERFGPPDRWDDHQFTYEWKMETSEGLLGPLCYMPLNGGTYFDRSLQIHFDDHGAVDNWKFLGKK